MQYLSVSAAVALTAILVSFSSVSHANAVTKAQCLKGNQFQKAAARNDTAFIQACLNARMPVDLVEGNGWTALHAAAFNGKAEAVTLLLKSGAKATLKDKNGKTALDLAKSKQHMAVAKILSAPRGTNQADSTSVSQPKAMALAEALRWELNTYGPNSSSDEIDYQIVKVRKAEKRPGPGGAGAVYSIVVEFKTGTSNNGKDSVIYKGTISESADGHLSVTDYKSA